jgi:hypothetical protein
METEKEVSYHEELHFRRITAVTSCKHGKIIVTGMLIGFMISP